nr:MAG TPA: hypothetical protein [Caudoviricetes sp.]
MLRMFPLPPPMFSSASFIFSSSFRIAISLL